MKAPKRWSLRTRLLIGVLSVVALGFGVAGFASVQLLRDYLTDRVDEQLRGAEAELSGLEIAQVGSIPHEPDLLDDYVVQFRDPQGNIELQLHGPSQRDTPRLPTLDTATVQRLAGKPFYVRNAGEPHGAGFRVLISERRDGKGSLVVAFDYTGTARTMARFVLIELAVMLTVLVLTALLGVMVVRVGLRPLTEVEQTAEEIVAGQDLSRRVPTLAGPGTEMGRLSRTLNTMLAAIDGSVTRLRGFVSDASHELRTPVTGIRGLAELYRQGAVTDPAEVAALIGRIELEATRMGLLVEDLLLLARLDEERPLRCEQVDLVPIAADAIEGKPVGLEIVGDADPLVIGDEDRLRQVVTNLVNNAMTHTPEGTPILVRVGVADGRALLEVVDSGPGIDECHTDRVFERFYRVDPARARDHSRAPEAGSGLGLSIVKALVHAHDGTVRHRPTPGGGATFSVTLPLAPA
ncbi:MAG TPA: HAMP domain-containing sensor histidine kinase [Candidatus Limnocylindrales bacterium]|nr:HAMP domain-containing sensor histidine kinase [Candidatus Limnocylindrales bacterium]